MSRTYNELKSRVQLLIDRDDAEEQVSTVDSSTVDMLDVFIANAEKRFYRSEAARIPPLEKTMSYTAGVGTGVHELAIPGDYFETRYLVATDNAGNQRTLSRVSPERILNTNTTISTVAIQENFAYGNNKWLVRAGSRQTTITANYYGFLAALSSLTADTDHWILNNADDLIMYLAASEAGAYYGSLDPQMVQYWDTKATEIMNNIVEQEIRQQSSGSTPRQGQGYRRSRNLRYW